MTALWLWVSAALAGTPRTVCDLQVASDGAVQSRGACPNEVVGAAATFAASARRPLSPHPTQVVVDGVEVQRVQVVLGRGAPKARLRPMVWVQRRVLPEVAASRGAPESCRVELSVSATGEVLDARPSGCGPAHDVVARAGSGWRFRPLVWNGEASAFQTDVAIPIVRLEDADHGAAGLEVAGELLSR